MNELERRKVTNESLRKGFDLGIAFALRHNSGDISKFISELARLRTWKSPEEWKEFVERNYIEVEDSRQEH